MSRCRQTVCRHVVQVPSRHLFLLRPYADTACHLVIQQQAEYAPVLGRSIPPPWRSIRFRLAPRTYAPWRVRVGSQAKSRKIPTRHVLPLLFVIRHPEFLLMKGPHGENSAWTALSPKVPKQPKQPKKATPATPAHDEI